MVLTHFIAAFVRQFILSLCDLEKHNDIVKGFESEVDMSREGSE